MPESDAVIEGITPTAKFLFVADMLGGPSRIRQFDLDGKDATRSCRCPRRPASADSSKSDGRILFRQTSFVAPAAWMLYDPAERQR